jgi:hypothetical protein
MSQCTALYFTKNNNSICLTAYYFQNIFYLNLISFVKKLLTRKERKEKERELNKYVQTAIGGAILHQSFHQEILLVEE